MNEAAIKIQTVIRCFLARKRVERKLKSHVQRTKVAFELAETERRYLSDLKALRVHYIGALLDSKLIDLDSANSLFCLSSLDEIIALSEQLEARLGAAVAQWGYNAVLGKSFTGDSAFLPAMAKVYGQYVIEFDAHHGALEKLLSHDKAVGEHCDRVRRECAQVHGLDVRSLMIECVQRVPRYSLLCRELVKYTEVDAADYVPLVEAQRALDDVGTQINELKKKADTDGVLDRLSSQIDDVDKVLSKIDKAKRKAHKHSGGGDNPESPGDRVHLRDARLRVYEREHVPRYKPPAYLAAASSSSGNKKSKKDKKGKKSKKDKKDKKDKKSKKKDDKGKSKKGKNKSKKSKKTKKTKQKRGRRRECTARLAKLVPAHQSAPADVLLKEAKPQYVVLFSDSMLFAQKIGALSSLSALRTRLTTSYRFSSPRFLHFETAHIAGAARHPDATLVGLELVRDDGIVTHTLLFESEPERQLWLSDYEQPTTRDINLDEDDDDDDDYDSESDSDSSESSDSSSDSD
jgi:RhoGEF domain/IQ calmodulin-binding motif